MEIEKKDNDSKIKEKSGEEEINVAESEAQVNVQNTKHLIHCLTIIGQIEGHYVLGEQNKTTRYEHIIPALVAFMRTG